MKRIASAFAIASTLVGCEASQVPVTSPQSLPSVVMAPEIDHVQKDPRAEIAKVLGLLGGNLCDAAGKGLIRTKPFTLTGGEVKANLLIEGSVDGSGNTVKEGVNAGDAWAWRFPEGLTDENLSHVIAVFEPHTHFSLPSCFSYTALRDGLDDIKLPPHLHKMVEECKAAHKPSIKNDGWNETEDALRKGGESPALSVCISHYGGDYDYSHAKFSEGHWIFAPSCWETVAASHFGLPPESKSPYMIYLEKQKEAVEGVRDCVQKGLKEGK